MRLKLTTSYQNLTAMIFNNAISWFEIPTTDLSRAKTFYETIFGCVLQPLDLDNIKMAMFPVQEGSVGGALCFAPDFYQPTSNGILLYLNGGENLQFVLDKVESAGGKITIHKTMISPEYGYMAVFTDTEGNRIGLHSIG